MTADPGPSTTHDSRLGAVLAECLQAEEAGQPVDRAALLARHPDLAPELRDFFEDHDRLRQAAGGTGAADTHDYDLLEEIGRGGMGVVYRARQAGTGRIVACKLILLGHLATPAEVERFRREAEAAARLDHPNIVPIYGAGRLRGQHFFSMKLIEGTSLATRLAEFTAEPRTAAALIAAVARAVAHAHERGILHRDLKPGNILLDADGNPHVTDFGLAKWLEGPPGPTTTGVIVGTACYMAPEQATGEAEVGPATDVYSLGVVLFELLTGRPPFRGATPLETVRRAVDDAPPRPRAINPGVPADLEAICLRCLEKRPADRYPTALALAEDLERWLAGQAILGRLSRRWHPRLPRLNRPKPGLVLVVALVLAILGGLLLFTGWDTPGHGVPAGTGATDDTTDDE